jgi:RNA polymerase sigma-70 factor (ECF subfamily)
MQRVQEGDAGALGKLFDRYSRLVFSVAMRILRDRTEAQDTVQDVFSYILRRSCLFDPDRGTVVCWVLQVAYSKSLKRHKRYYTGPLALRVPLDVVDCLADPEMAPQRVTAKLSAGKTVRVALMELTKAQRETLCLYFFEGYSLAQVSRKRNESLGNTRHHFYRGIAALRPILKSANERITEQDQSWRKPALCGP